MGLAEAVGSTTNSWLTKWTGRLAWAGLVNDMGKPLIRMSLARIDARSPAQQRRVTLQMKGI
jgi:hypothetical protein